MAYKKIEQVAAELVTLHLSGMNWDEIGAKFGTSGGTVHRIALENYEPKKTDLRVRFGLSAMKEAPACWKCGEVHVTKTCQKDRKPTTIRRLDDYSVKALRWAIEHREEF